MRTGRSSETARVSALMRAAHPLLDSKPWIFNDELAAAFCGLDDETSVRAAVSAFQEDLARGASASLARAWIRTSRLSVALRARYVEDELGKALGNGVSQYVILGAGLDSFAYRRRDLAARLRVFEMDHPDTQEAKRTRLRLLDIPVPPHVEFVPVDFEEPQSILDVLQGNGYRRDEPAFFSWLGVTWYLSDAAIDRTLQEVAAAATGSEVVLDYLLPEALLADEERQILRMLESMAAGRGEPGRSCFEPGRIAQRLRALGFTRLVDFGAVEANARYCTGRADGLRIPKLLHLLKARVERPSAASLAISMSQPTN